MFGIAFDQGFDKGSLANARGTDNCDDNGRSLFWEAVDEGDMETLFFDLALCQLTVLSLRAEPPKQLNQHVHSTIYIHRASAQLALPNDQDSHSQRLWDYDLPYVSSSPSSCDAAY